MSDLHIFNFQEQKAQNFSSDAVAKINRRAARRRGSIVIRFSLLFSLSSQTTMWIVLQALANAIITECKF